MVESQLNDSIMSVKQIYWARGQLINMSPRWLLEDETNNIVLMSDLLPENKPKQLFVYFLKKQ